ncbi:cytidylyltransferase family-domain-containing protein [Pavlovales sp. CCMP2436]|nr:cytidylyltransferase family-domain-containing protein [Pavlovales sp. CCMP2436]|mmetsp:Transcript_21104/g.49961  ORF Transcript_21104/g.49961 Transcript_21104/m.49961 type:complete len:495 (+) Transcript_21104:55-1539(+)
MADFMRQRTQGRTWSQGAGTRKSRSADQVSRAAEPFANTRQPPPPRRPAPGGISRANSFESELGDTEGEDGDQSSADEGAAERMPPSAAVATLAAAAEKKGYKKLVRAASAALMLATALLVLRIGHLAVMSLVFAMQVMIFKEVTMVRYRTAKSPEVPMFRTIQWLWFAVAIFFSYGGALSNTMPTPLSRWLHRRKYRVAIFAFVLDNHEAISLLGYSAVFVLTVLSFKKHYYRYQLGQLSWTMVTVWICVGQLHAVMTNIFTGLFWFVYPVSLVVVNDCMAYFCGMALGRKLIKREFLRMSPNKTWEGFLGGGLFTLVWAVLAPRLLCRWPGLICQLTDFDNIPRCHAEEVHDFSSGFPLFMPKRYVLLPTLLQTLLGVSGEVELYPIQMHGVGFGIFASLVAPFGGYLASTIKRAYKVKDFEQTIPGHGGVMDRMDCQLLMALFTTVYLNAFVRMEVFSVNSMLNTISRLAPVDQVTLYRGLKAKLRLEGAL